MSRKLLLLTLLLLSACSNTPGHFGVTSEPWRGVSIACDFDDHRSDPQNVTCFHVPMHAPYWVQVRPPLEVKHTVFVDFPGGRHNPVLGDWWDAPSQTCEINRNYPPQLRECFEKHCRLGHAAGKMHPTPRPGDLGVDCGDGTNALDKPKGQAQNLPQLAITTTTGTAQ